MNPAEKSAAQMDTLGFDASFRCPCGGGWWYDGDVLGGSVHLVTCPLRAALPPRRATADETNSTTREP